MKIPSVVHILKIWEPSSGRISRRIIFKDQAVIGSDPQADLKLKELPGLAARIQFSEKRVELLAEARSFALESQQIFTLGPYAILWTTLSWNALEKWKWTAIGAVFLVLSALLYGAWMGMSPACNQLETKLAKSQWSTRGLSEDEAQFLKSYRTGLEAVRRSMEERNWIRLRSELRELERDLDQRTQREACQTDRSLADIKFKLARLFFREHLQNAELEEAAASLEEILNSKDRPQAKGLKRELLKAAREMYLAGYRLEDDDPSKGVEMKDRASEICQRLGSESCFEGMEETDHQKAKTN